MKYRLSKNQRNNLIRICVCLAAFIVVFAVDKSIELSSVIGGKFGFFLPFGLYLAIFVAIGYDVIGEAVRGIFHGELLDEHFLMCVATFGAFALAIVGGVTGKGTEGFDEACAVLLFYQVGEFFQTLATDKARKSISSLMDIRPDTANVLRDGEIVTVDPYTVEIGETVIVNPGERVALDGVCIRGSSTLDTKALTGESKPQELAEGGSVLSGSVNITSRFEMRVEKKFENSTATKILELVENASDKKSKTENFITKFARIYTPVVIAAAVLLLIIPGAVTGDWLTWLYRSLSFLVVSCPCALVISIPLSFFAGVGACSKNHILVKGSNFLETFRKANVFVFDKTGTLTKGNFAVSEVFPKERRDEILRLAAISEQGSSHPIARSIVDAYGKETETVRAIENVAGMGVIAKTEENEIACGNARLMQKLCIPFDEYTGVGTVVYVSKDREYIGYIVITDEVKPETVNVIKALNDKSLRTVMLTGDNSDVASDVACRTGIKEYRASLLPADKVENVDGIIKHKSKKDVVCFVGDGLNDAPVLMRADVGIAMGGVGSDAAIEAADVVLMKDDLSGLLTLKRVANKTMRIAYENIFFSLAVKLVILILSALGITNMWVAIFGDVGVAILAILNSMRCLRFKK